MRLAVVILAGGEGRRIGGGKPQRLLAGRPLIDHALAFARGWSSDVAIAVRAPPFPADEPLLPDRWGEGPISGLASALDFAADRGLAAVLAIPVDSPFLPTDLPVKLAEALVGHAAAVPLSAGRTHPACALWRNEAAAALPAYLEAGRSSLNGFAEHVGFTRVEWPAEPLDPFFNVNTEADLAEAEALIRSR